MLYVSGKCSNGHYFVTDTSDYVTEEWAEEDLLRVSKEYGIKILGVTSVSVNVYTLEMALVNNPDARFRSKQRKLALAGQDCGVEALFIDHSGSPSMKTYTGNWLLSDLANDFSTDVDFSECPFIRIMTSALRREVAKSTDRGRLILPDSLRGIDSYALLGCGASQIIFKAPVEELGIKSFANSRIESMYLPLSEKAYVSRFLFEGCSWLRQVILDGGVIVTSTAFASCFALEEVHFSESFKVFAEQGAVKLDYGSLQVFGTEGKTKWYVWCKEPVLVNTQILTLSSGDWYFSSKVNLESWVLSDKLAFGMRDKSKMTIHFPKGQGLREYFLQQTKELEEVAVCTDIEVVEDDWQEEFNGFPRRNSEGVF